MRPIFKRGWPCRMLALGIAFTPIPAMAGAQSAASSFEQLQLLVGPGDTVSVTDTTGREVTGTIIRISSSVLVLAGKGVDKELRREWPEERVSLVRQHRRDSLANGALIGAAIGGGLGFLGGLQCSGELYCVASTGQVFVLGLGVGAAVGIGVDALVRSRPVIYRHSGSRATSLEISGGPRGVVAAWRF